MACYRPLLAWQDVPGQPLRFSPMGASPEGDLEIACGQCIGCRLDRSRNWAVRIVCERKCHRASSFLTLTFDDDHCPPDMSIDYPFYMIPFFKRARYHLGPLRHFTGCEYGGKFGRPHYHVCLFGHDFSSDRRRWSGSTPRDTLYDSPTLSKLWPYGRALIGDLTFDSAAYVARYCVEKITGDRADEHYTWIHPESGEIFRRKPEVAHMSLKPGIGKPWYDRYGVDIKNLGGVVINGRLVNPPPYFNDLLAADDALNGTLFSDDQEYQRFLAGKRDRVNQTIARLYAREQVAYARLALKKAVLE